MSTIRGCTPVERVVQRLQAPELLAAAKEVQALLKLPNDVALAEYVICFNLHAAGVKFLKEPLQQLSGIILYRSSTYTIVYAERLNQVDRLRLYLHVLGHIAQGHLDNNDIDVWLEVNSDDKSTLPAKTVCMEEEADAWVKELQIHYISDSSGGARAFKRGTLKACIPWFGTTDNELNLSDCDGRECEAACKSTEYSGYSG